MNVEPMVERILVVRDALDLGECQRLMQIYVDSHQYGTQKDYSGNKSLHYFDLYEHGLKEQASLLKRVALRGQEIVQEQYKEPHVVEATFIARQLPGSVIEPHYDNVRLDGTTPNHTPQRTHSSLFYLNADYEGGQLVFPKQGLELVMTPGMFVAFPSGAPYLHMVRPIRKANRYTAPVWMTTDPGKKLMFKED